MSSAASGEAGRQSGQHRGVAEHLTHPDDVEHPPVVNDFDHAGSYDPQELAGVGPLGEDDRPAKMEFDVGRGGGTFDFGPGKGVERRVRQQELHDLRYGSHGFSVCQKAGPPLARSGPNPARRGRRNRKSGP